MSRAIQERTYAFETQRAKIAPAGARAIVGVRVSAVGERDAETATSAPDQRGWAAWKADAQGWELVDVDAEDLNVPGDVWDERQGLWRAVEAIEAGEAEVLMFQNAKRLARDVELGFHVRRRVEQAGGWLVLGDVPDGAPAAMVGMMLGAGQDDHDEKKGYLRAAKIRAVENGANVGKVPFGYDKDEDGILVPNPVTAPIVVELFELRARGGSWRELGELMRARTGKFKPQATLNHMLQNRKYLGEQWFENLRNTRAHDAIVTADLFDAANARAGKARPRTGTKGLLSGMARCGTCGAPMGTTMGGGKGYMRRLYRCGNAVECAGPAQGNAEKIDAIVKADVWDWIEGRGQADREFLTYATDEQAVAAARFALDAAEADASAWATGSVGLPVDAVMEGSAARVARIAAARAELARVEASSSIAAARVKLRALWPTLDDAELRFLLGEIGLRVIVRRAPRGTDLAARVETIVGGAFRTPTEDELDRSE